MNPVWRGLTQSHAETHPTSVDPRLRGRTYAISFDRVWRAATSLADGGQRGWRVIHADDQGGVLRAVSRTLVFGRLNDVEIVIRLDENAQTRVDARTRARNGKGDLGRGPRLIGGFFRRLDQALGAGPRQILDPAYSTGTQPA